MKLSPSVFRSLIFLFFSLSVVTMQAQGPKRVIPDSIRISLLTCASGEEIYSLFGHTAIRYENYTRGIDAVFNYGIFNFNAPNFILPGTRCLAARAESHCTRERKVGYVT